MARIKKPQKPLGRTYFREWRKFRNLSQEEAAARLNLSRTMLSKIETGQKPYTQHHLEAAATAYQTEPASILSRNPLDDSSPLSMVSRLERAAPAEREAIERFLKTFLKAG
jgi:transcriptional regulator with XRE-family HTH domain